MATRCRFAGSESPLLLQARGLLVQYGDTLAHLQVLFPEAEPRCQQVIRGMVNAFVACIVIASQWTITATYAFGLPFEIVPLNLRMSK